MKIEHLILSKFIFDNEYVCKVFPFIKPEYFLDKLERIIISMELDFYTQYNKLASKEALLIDVQKLDILTQEEYNDINTLINDLNPYTTNIEWALNSTEEFCKEQALQNALRKVVKLSIENDSKTGLTKGAIPKILSDALAVSFDTKIGHDYIKDIEKRFDYYHNVDEKIPLSLPILNKITKGGFGRRTLNMFLMASHVGKSMLMAHEAAYLLLNGYNVLYITLEMREEEIARRIDSMLLEIPIEDLSTCSKEHFMSRADKLKLMANGRLKIREFPTGAANASHFRHLLHELQLKDNFKPDIIYIDYLNICSSVNVKLSGKVDTYTLYRCISEELRALAIEYDVPVCTSTQMNRNGTKSTDPDMTDIADSFSVIFSLDFLLAGYKNEMLNQLNQIAFTQLKNRYRNKDLDNRFNLHFDSIYMKYSEVNSNINLSVQDVPKQKSLITDKSKQKFFGLK